MTEELRAILCRLCAGEGVLHSRCAEPIRYTAEPVYVETHRLCPHCAGDGIDLENYT